MRPNRMSLVLGCALLCVSCLSAPTLAATIEVGDISMAGGVPGQTFQLYVRGGERVGGMDLYVQIGRAPNGGRDADGPKITGIDIFTGTIFQDNNTGPGGGDFVRPSLAIATTTTQEAKGDVVADGVIATITIDTTGAGSGTYAVKIYGTLNGDTDLGLLNTDNGLIMQNGHIHTPEPACLGLSLVAGIGLLLARRRIN